MTKNVGWRMVLTATAVAAFASVAGTISAASGPERSLAGIPIFAPGSLVTHKFGNPSRILVGGASAATAGGGTGSPGAGGGYPGGGGGGGGYPGAGGGGVSTAGGPTVAGAGLLPGFGGIPTGGGGYPGGGGGGYPGGGGGGGYPGGGGRLPWQAGAAFQAGEVVFPVRGGGTDTTGTAMPGRQPVTLVYDRAHWAAPWSSQSHRTSAWCRFAKPATAAHSGLHAASSWGRHTRRWSRATATPMTPTSRGRSSTLTTKTLCTAAFSSSTRNWSESSSPRRINR